MNISKELKPDVLKVARHARVAEDSKGTVDWDFPSDRVQGQKTQIKMFCGCASRLLYLGFPIIELTDEDFHLYLELYTVFFLFFCGSIYVKIQRGI